MLRFQFISNILGPLTVEGNTEGNPDPIGINEMTQVVKRSDENEGVVYEITFDLDFIKQSRRYLKQAFEQTGGIDAEVLVNVYQYDPNTRKWVQWGTGKVNFAKYDVYEDKLTVNMEQVGFQTRVLNLLDTDINLEATESIGGTALPPTPTFQIPYHSKTIYKTTSAEPVNSGEGQFLDVMTFDIPCDPAPTDPTLLAIWIAEGHPFSVDRDAVVFGSIATNKKSIDELDDFFEVDYSYIAGPGMGGHSHKTTDEFKTFLMGYKDSRFELYRAKEAGTVSFKIDINLRSKVSSFNTGGDVDICGEGSMGFTEILYWVEVRDSSDNIVVLENILRMPDTDCGETEFGYLQERYTYTNTAIQVGYKVYVYHTIRIFGEYERPSGINDGHVHHDFIIQNSPIKWDDPRNAARTFSIDDTVVYHGLVYKSKIDNNLAHTPSTTPNDFWLVQYNWTGQEESTAISITNATIAPVTPAKTILLYDAFLKCCQYITNQVDSFKSNLLGRTELGYTEDGEGALIGWTNGGLLRRLPDKILFANLQELVDFTNSVFCVGFGFEIEGGRTVLRLERREFFYNKNVTVVSLGKVYNIKKSLDSKRFYKEIEYGYQGKLDIGKVNAVDEFNTLRRANIPIINTKNKYKISVKTRTSGYQIEAQRRLQFSTTDSKLDDENFAICLIRDVTIEGGLRTKQDEGYTSIINVLDPHTGYNYDISPARCLKNWYQFLGSMLIRSFDKTVKFTYGEVNYRMASKKIGETEYLREDGTFDVGQVEPLFEPFNYTFANKLTRDEFKLIKAMPYGVIEFEDQHGEKFEAYVSSDGVEGDPFKGMGDFKLLHVYRP